MLTVLVPAAVFVLAIPYLGIYVAGALFIAAFMTFVGKYQFLKGLGVGAAVSLAFFLIFQKWFLIRCRTARSSGLSATEADRRGRYDAWNFGDGAAAGLPDRPDLPEPALMLLGIVLGVLIGVLPGLGGANGVAILLPLTFTMSPTSAIIMLSCIYWGALFGGAITSVLFNIPGEPWSVATTFDGHPMAKQGRAGEALTAAFTWLLRRRLRCRAAHHLPVAAGRQLRPAIRPAPSSSPSIFWPSAASSAWARSRPSRPSPR